MKQLYLDIETIPDNIEAMPKQDDLEYYVEPVVISKGQLTPPVSYTNPDTIEKWIAKNWAKAQESNLTAVQDATAQSVELYQTAYDKWAKGCFSHFTGRIIAISFAIQDEPVQGRYIGQPGISTEKALMAEFLSCIDEIYNTYARGYNSDTIRWVGFNAFDFDLPYLWWQALKHLGHEAARIIPNTSLVSKYKHQQVYDPMIHAPLHRNFGKPQIAGQDKMCKALELEGKSLMSGADVLPNYLDGKMKLISEYCNSDVEQLRELTKLLGEHEK